MVYRTPAGVALACLLFALGEGAVAAAPADAATYPAKAVRIVVNAAPGGANDVLGRMVATSMTGNVGQNVIVDNRGGAGGNVGAEIVAHAAPDGYTVLYGTTAVAVNVSLYPKLNFQLRELAPVTLAARFPLAITVTRDSPAKNIQELIALSRQRGGLTYGSPGPGSVNHLAGVLLNKLAHLDNVHVPYKGAGPMMTALVSSEIDMATPNVFTAMPYVKAGRLRALAVTSAKPVSSLPGVPPLAAEFPGFDMTLWHGYFTTSGTPAATVARLNSDIVKALKSPAIRDAIANSGGELVGNTPEQFALVLEHDSRAYAELVKISGAKAD
jgi:tripartite-type tricarboxylate transporter receptor subunit TctC